MFYKALLVFALLSSHAWAKENESNNSSFFCVQNLKYLAYDLPKEVNWPPGSTYTDVVDLLTPQDKSLMIDFLHDLPKGAIFLDIGCGEGLFLSHLKQKRPDIKTVGATISRRNYPETKRIDEIFLQYVPDDITLLSAYIGKVDVVTDTFSAATFAKNPVHALIYYAFLLKEGGHFYAISALLTEYKDMSAFGDDKTREKIKKFFQKELGINLFFEKKKRSLRGELIEDMLVYFVKSKTSKYNSVEEYEKLIQLSNKEIGVSIMPKEATLYIHPRTYLQP